MSLLRQLEFPFPDFFFESAMKSLALLLIFGLAGSALATSSVVDTKRKGASRSNCLKTINRGAIICQVAAQVPVKHVSFSSGNSAAT